MVQLQKVYICVCDSDFSHNFFQEAFHLSMVYHWKVNANKDIYASFHDFKVWYIRNYHFNTA